MNKLKKLIASSAVCLSIALIPSCSNSEKHENTDSKEHAEEANENNLNREGEKDADRMIEAYCGNLYELKASENAVTKASTADVKKLAGMMVESHTKMNADIQALAAKKTIMLPTGLTDEQNRKMENLNEKTGLDYDKEYADQMKDKHDETIKTLEKSADKAEDPEIKQWASSSIPEVRSHLDMIEATCNNLKDMKDDNKNHDKNHDNKNGDHKNNAH